MNNDLLAINTLRLLGVDMINQANSGHPGIVLGAAPIMHTLFTRHLIVDPQSSDWFNRDRFIMSAGHGSALLYATLHLAGFNVSLEDLKQFRQYNSKTPGHPELGHTDGVEMTTGPLGQGIASAVGVAISERHLAGVYNKEGNIIMNHKTYVLCGDGDLQEGVAIEACSLAGHLGLNNLIVLYDSNDIQLDSEVKLTNTESTKAKFEAMNWNYIRVDDGNDIDLIDRAIATAKTAPKPTIIEVKTIIGYGSPVSGDTEAHGTPLGPENTQRLREFFKYEHAPFKVDLNVYQLYKDTLQKRGTEASNAWGFTLNSYQNSFPDDYETFLNSMNNEFEMDVNSLSTWQPGEKLSTRASMGSMLNEISMQVRNLMGGSADLSASTYVRGLDGEFSKQQPSGRNIKFGVREHAMAAIVNGMTLHGGTRGFCGGFLTFSDYMKPSIRMAAMMKLNSLFFFTHDSLAVGEDGPTHQPVEQLAMLRSIPNLSVYRPADSNEMKIALAEAMNAKDYPTAIIATRQNVTTLPHTANRPAHVGGYVAFEPQGGQLRAILITCGSELEVCIQVAMRLQQEGIFVRVVSMPNMFLFERQDPKYREQVLPTQLQRRLAVEMGSPMPWYKYSRMVYGVNSFGISAPADYVKGHFGFTEERITQIMRQIASQP